MRAFRNDFVCSAGDQTGYLSSFNYTVAAAVVIGGRTACSLSSNNASAIVTCKGDNTFEQLGIQSVVPNGGGAVSLPSGTFAQSISSGMTYFCAHLSNGNAACWGDNTFGQLGTGSGDKIGGPGTMGDNLPSVTLPPSGSIGQVYAGYYHTCVLKSGANLLASTCAPRSSKTNASAGTCIALATTRRAHSVRESRPPSSQAAPRSLRSTSARASLPQRLRWANIFRAQSSATRRSSAGASGNMAIWHWIPRPATARVPWATRFRMPCGAPMWWTLPPEQCTTAFCKPTVYAALATTRLASWAMATRLTVAVAPPAALATAWNRLAL